MVVGILSSGSGLGGGFLVVPLLIYLGREAKLAVGTSFVFILMVAVSSVLEERAARELIPKLRAAGGHGIVEYPLNKIVL